MRCDLADLKQKTAAVILAAGAGSRMKLDRTKQTIVIYGKSVLRRTLEAFDNSSCVSSITVVCKSDELEFAIRECKTLKKQTNVVIGGKSRAESAMLGFKSIPDDSEFVMIHDGARCLITPFEIDTVANGAYEYGSATASYAVTDTIKLCDENSLILRTVPRNGLRFVQTPQAFSVDLYNRALKNTPVLDDSITDDNMLIEKLGEKIFCADTSSRNIKITTNSDIELAEFIIKKMDGEV